MLNKVRNRFEKVMKVIDYKLRYSYYVIYMFERENGDKGIGKVESASKKKIKTFEDIEELRQSIIEDSIDTKDVMIMSFTRVKTKVKNCI